MHRIPRFASLLALLGVLLVAGFSGILPYGTGKEVPLWLFAGRFHPLIIHLPIGLMSLVAIFEIIARIRHFNHLEESIVVVLFFAALSAGAAAVAGCLLAYGGGDFSDAIRDHLRAGVAFAAATFLLVPLKHHARKAGTIGSAGLYYAFLGATLMLMTVASHFGGNLTHGPDYLTKYMPAALGQIVGQGKAGQSGAEKQPTPTIQQALITPALEARCFACHNATKTKGGLRLDTLAGILKGGDTGPGITPGKPDESEVLRRILLPADDDDFMPPDGKPALSKEQTEVIRWWVQSGLPGDASLDAINDAPDFLKSLVEKAKNDGNSR